MISPESSTTFSLFSFWNVFIHGNFAITLRVVKIVGATAFEVFRLAALLDAIEFSLQGKIENQSVFMRLNRHKSEKKSVQNINCSNNSTDGIIQPSEFQKETFLCGQS
jgi:hypothetical protein